MNDVQQAWERAAEDRRREREKAAAYTRPIRVEDSLDPEAGLQPAIGSHDAWPYRPGPVVKPAGYQNAYAGGVARDLAEERRTAEGERFVPRCTGCLGRLDPQWCGNIAPDDRDAR